MTTAPQASQASQAPQAPNVPEARHAADQETRSAGAIVGDISRDMSTLVRQEVELAKTELRQELSRAGKGAGMFGGAGVAGLMTLIFGSLALTYLLDRWMAAALAALITAALWGAAAGVLALRGRRQLQRAQLQLPQTQETLKEDIAWVRARNS